MRKFLILIFIAAVCVSNISSGQLSNVESKYKVKIDRFTHLKSAGSTLLICGSVCAVTGTVLTFSSANRMDNDEEDLDQFFQGLVGLEIGLVALAAGVGMSTAGIVMNSIGNRKIREYQSKLKNLSMGVIYNPGMKGISLVYRF